MIGNQGLTERRYTRRRVHGGLRARREPAWGQASSVKRQAAGVESGGWEQPVRGVGGAWVPLCIMSRPIYYVYHAPLVASRGALGTSWVRANAGPCVRMQRPPAGNHRQPCSASPRHTGAESRASIECIKCRVQTECKAIAEPTAEPLQPAGGDAVCAAGAFAPKLSSQKSTTY
jgi:hypothetical protein